MKIFNVVFPLVLVVFCEQLKAQDTLKIAFHFPFEKSAVWDVDVQQNLYYSANKSIFKLDSTGKLMFQQSIFSFGNCTKIDARNVSKIALFSYDQQTIRFYDNTLSENSKQITAEDLGIQLLKDITMSTQSDRLWLLDEIQNKLVLYREDFPLQINLSQTREKENAQTIEEVDQNVCVGYNDHHYVFYNNFGEIQQELTDSVNSSFIPWKENKVYLLNNKLVFQNNENANVNRSVFIPILADETILQYKIRNKKIYFQTEKRLLICSFPE